MSSFNRVTFTGAEDTIPVPFGYIDKSHVGVTIDGTTTTAFTWLSSGLIKLNSTPPSGVVGEAKRTTPASRLVVFSPGNLDVDDLNVSTWQAILIAEEAKDTLNDLLGRGWVTSGFQLGGTITKAGLGFVPTFDASGNLTLVTSAEDIVAAQGYASAALGYRNEAQGSALSAAGSASLASGYAASINPANFYTKAEIDGYRTTDQNAAKNASNLTSGTVANSRLPLRLNEIAGSNGIDDANDAVATGWYMARNTAANLPSANYGFLEVQAVSVNEIRQYLTLTTGAIGEKWTRRYGSGSWSSWVRVYETASEIQSIPEPWVTSGQYALVNNGDVYFAHGLGATPSSIEAYYVCTTANNGYAVGETVGPFNTVDYAAAYFGCQVTADATNVRAHFAQNASAIVMDRSTGAPISGGAPVASWRLVLRARK